MLIPGFSTGQTIYESQHSVVCRGTREEDGVPVMLKFLNAEDPQAPDIAALEREHEIALGLLGLGVPATFGAIQHGSTVCLVVEDLGGDSLSTVLRWQRRTLDDFFLIALRVAESVGAIQQKDIIHKDINSSNILWNRGTGGVRTIDSGIASRLCCERSDEASAKGSTSKMAEDRYQSAFELRYDLEQCAAQVRHGGAGSAFVPGKADFSDKLRIPQHLFGRDQEIGQLEATISQARQVAAQLVLSHGAELSSFDDARDSGSGRRERNVP